SRLQIRQAQRAVALTPGYAPRCRADALPAPVPPAISQEVQPQRRPTGERRWQERLGESVPREGRSGARHPVRCALVEPRAARPDRLAADYRLRRRLARGCRAQSVLLEGGPRRAAAAVPGPRPL